MISSQISAQARSRFSEAAACYDKLAFIQNQVRQELMDKLRLVDGIRILDVGCGTGQLVQGLQSRAPGALIVGIDMARGMVEGAHAGHPQGHFAQALSGALPFSSGSFDLVVSSSAYQWSSDLGASFGEARRVLKDGGVFHAALFGRDTFREFFESLRTVSPRIREGIRGMGALPAHDDVRRALEAAAFLDAMVFVEKRQTVFRDLWSLMTWIKSVGANNLGRGIFLGKQTLAKAEEHYRAHYSVDGGLAATFEVVWVKTRK